MNGKSRESWRTPSASDGEGGVKTAKSIKGDKQPKIKLRDHVAHTVGMESKAKLNPAWVEQLMGVPAGWTELKDGNNRVDRLRLLGNGVVPATAEKAFVTLMNRISNPTSKHIGIQMELFD